MTKKLKLEEIAGRITVHLRRFEQDPKINRKRTYDDHTKKWRDDPRGLGNFYCPHAWWGGRVVYVSYVSYQGSGRLTRDEAEAYLAALDAGFTKTHYEIADRLSPSNLKK